MLVNNKEALLTCLNYTPYILCFKSLKMYANLNGGVLVSMLASSAVGRGFEPCPVKSKTIYIFICCISAKYAALRSKGNK